MITAVLLAIGCLRIMRPWRTDDDYWFHHSALLAAVLLGCLLIALSD